MLKYAISLTLEVPLAYAYGWCTDFRNDDYLIVGGGYPRHILRRKKDVLVWTQPYRRNGVEKVGVRIITLKPPNSWHNEAINDEKESSIDYRLTPLGKGMTRLSISVKVHYKSIEPEDVSVLERNLSSDWAKYKAALERDYASGKPADG